MNQNNQWRGQQADFAERSMWKQEFSNVKPGERLIEDVEPWWYDEK